MNGKMFQSLGNYWLTISFSSWFISRYAADFFEREMDANVVNRMRYITTFFPDLSDSDHRSMVLDIANHEVVLSFLTSFSCPNTLQEVALFLGEKRDPYRASVVLNHENYLLLLRNKLGLVKNLWRVRIARFFSYRVETIYSRII